jgi:hypothetical protein
MRRILTWVPPVIFILLVFSLFATEVNDPLAPGIRLAASLLIVGSACTFWIVIIPRILRANMNSTVKKLLEEGSNHAAFGWREMEIVDGRLCVTTELVHSVYDLRAVEKIAENDDYTFVYIAAVEAFIIPMQRFPEEEYQEFVIELREAWKNRETLPLLLTPPPRQASPADSRFTERTN